MIGGLEKVMITSGWPSPVGASSCCSLFASSFISGFLSLDSNQGSVPSSRYAPSRHLVILKNHPFRVCYSPERVSLEHINKPFRSEERRVGKEWVSTVRSRGSPY